MQSTAGLAALTDVVHTHAWVCTLKEMTGHVDVWERSFASTAWTGQGVSVLETILDYTFQPKIVGLCLQLHVRPYCGKYDCPGSSKWQSGFASRGSGTYVVEKCSGFLPGISDSVLPFMLMITSCSILWLAEMGFFVWSGKCCCQTKVPCSGLTLPPSPQKYDICWGEVFSINK